MKKFLLSLATVLCAGAFANAAEVTFDFSTSASAGEYGIPTGKGNDDYIKNKTVTNGDVTINFNASAGNGWRWWDDGMRAYGKQSSNKPTLTISAGGADITSIEIVYGNTKATYSANVGTWTQASDNKSGTWTGSAAEVVLTMTKADNTAAANTVKVVFTATNVDVEAPEFSVEAGVYTAPVNVELSTKTPDCRIYYTTDGSTPSDESTLYTEPIEISKYTKLSAIAYNSDDKASYVTSGIYAFQNTEATAMTVAEALAWIADGEDDTTNQYVAGTITAITEVSSQYGNATYYIADAGDNAETLYVYRGRYLNNEGFTSDYVATDPDNCQIKVGDDVIIYGNLMNFKGNSPQIGQGNYIVKLVTTGVEGIEIEENNAPVEYFNLQGVRVDNPANGLYIMRQGDKVTKVIK